MGKVGRSVEQGRIWYRVWNGVERSGAELAERDGRDWVGKKDGSVRYGGVECCGVG